MNEIFNVVIVDDMPAIVRMIGMQLTATGQFSCTGFTSATELLGEYDPRDTDCIVADIKMPIVDGVELHQNVVSEFPDLSFVFLTGQADVRTAVQLMEQGAFTLLEKPFKKEELINKVYHACRRTSELKSRRQERSEIESRFAELTEDEREVMEYILAGESNKTMAADLAMSLRTIDRRRLSVFEKMGVQNASELIAQMAVHRRQPHVSAVGARA